MNMPCRKHARVGAWKWISCQVSPREPPLLPHPIPYPTTCSFSTVLTLSHPNSFPRNLKKNVWLSLSSYYFPWGLVRELSYLFWESNKRIRLVNRYYNGLQRNFIWRLNSRKTTLEYTHHFFWKVARIQYPDLVTK